MTATCAVRSVIFWRSRSIVISLVRLRASGDVLLDLGFDNLPDPLQGRLGRGLKAQDQRRLGVRGTDQSPAVGEEDSHSVDVNDLVRASQLLLGLLHHLELDVVGTVHADLRRGHCVGQIGKQRRERPAGLGEDLDQAARRIDGVIVPEVAVGEEDMAGQVAGQRGLLLLQLGLDHGVAGPPHDGSAAVLGDVIIEDLGRLDFGDDRGARLLLQDVPGEQHHELVAPEDLSFLVHRADPIGAVDEKGQILWGDKLMVLFSRDILKEKPGATIISEVKASQVFYDDVAKHGGRPIMMRTGHSVIKAKLKEEKAALAGELSGHIFFADRYFGYDDAIYASCRLIEILAKAGRPLSMLLTDLPVTVSTPEIRVECPDDVKFQ